MQLKWLTFTLVQFLPTTKTPIIHGFRTSPHLPIVRNSEASHRDVVTLGAKLQQKEEVRHEGCGKGELGPRNYTQFIPLHQQPSEENTQCHRRKVQHSYSNNVYILALSTAMNCTYSIITFVPIRLKTVVLPMRKLALDADCPNCCSMYLALKVISPIKELNLRMLPQRSRK